MQVIRVFLLLHCVRSFSGLSAFGLNAEIFRVNLRIQSECGKIWTKKSPNTNTFHVVLVFYDKKHRQYYENQYTRISSNVFHGKLIDFFNAYKKCIDFCNILKYVELKSDPRLPKNSFICFNKSSLKMMKNAFYSTLKALFALEIFIFLSWIFGHVEKTTWLEKYG